jgi:hypothetical protein
MWYIPGLREKKWIENAHSPKRRVSMAEIKSTLELVMERTRHLTLTEEDRREQALAEFKKSLNGLLTRFQDGSLRLDQFQAAVSALQEHSCLTDRKIIIEEIAGRLDLDRDNGWAFNLLEEAFRVNIKGVAAVVGEYREAIESMTQNLIGETREHLLKHYGISGSAVVPNIAAYPVSTLAQKRLRERFEPTLAQEISKM